MCGRFTQDLDEEELIDLYDLDSAEPRQALRSRWNGAPTQEFALCRMDHTGRRVLAQHRWGLVPPWARDPKIGARLINARSESADSKPSFRSAFRRRRCLIPANGWFEWRAAAGVKQPWWISLEGGPFSFAGLWEAWDKGGGPMYSFTILTCPATESLKAIHDRQPSIIPPTGTSSGWIPAPKFRACSNLRGHPIPARSIAGGSVARSITPGTTIRRFSELCDFLAWSAEAPACSTH